MNSALWSALRWWIRLRRGRVSPASVPDPIWYFAYGSNMNERLFRERPAGWCTARSIGCRCANSLVWITYKVPHAAPEGRPGRRYFQLIREAARRRGLPAEYVAFLDRVETRE